MVLDILDENFDSLGSSVALDFTVYCIVYLAPYDHSRASVTLLHGNEVTGTANQ